MLLVVASECDFRQKKLNLFESPVEGKSPVE